MSYTTSPVAHPGWLVLTPEQEACSWYKYDLSELPDEASVMALFEPRQDIRDRLLASGWTVCAGTGYKLFPDSADFEQASA